MQIASLISRTQTLLGQQYKMYTQKRSEKCIRKRERKLRWEYDIKMNLEGINYNMEWSQIALHRIEW
jgi:hypothetical protein